MGTKTKALILIVWTIMCVGIGRYTVATKEIDTKHTDTTDTKKTDENTKTDTKQDDNTDTKTTTIIIVKPDGTKTTETTTESKKDDNTETKVDDTKKETDTSKTDTTETKEITRNGSKVNISILGGIDLAKPGNGMLYGGHITKNILGPINVGVFGLSNGSCGVSVGIDF